MATYYQNILQARAGKLTETETWQRLYEGFQRGMANNEYSNLSLARLSPKMHSTRSYMRLYWSGTAYFLAMDLALRQREPGPTSLDEVIAGYTRCCLAGKRRTNGAELLDDFDQLAGGNNFKTLFDTFSGLKASPSPQGYFEQLGIRTESGRVVLDKDGPKACLRKQITFGSGTAC